MFIDESMLEINYDKLAISEIKRMNLPVVLLGCGDVAIHVRAILEKNGITDITYAASKGFSGGLSPEQTDEKYNEYILVPAFEAAYISDGEYAEFKNKVKIFTFCNLYDEIEQMDVSYFHAHYDEFEHVYGLMADEKSKRSLKSFLLAKITGKMNDVGLLLEKPQYFGREFISVHEDESLVDCGAYNGDSIKDFLAWTNGKYESIYAFEPDKYNFNDLNDYIKENQIKYAYTYNCGTSNSGGVLRFNSGNGVYSKFDENAEDSIVLDTIDNVLSGKRASFIKMDIEGSEKEALKGAENTIRKYRPVLAISAYHKRDDIFEIQKMISFMVDNYKYYFRLHKGNITVDAVLYAVPEERVEAGRA
jgi:FkbM family methyltransferase